MFFESKAEMFLKTFAFFNLILKFIKIYTFTRRKYLLVEKQISISTNKYRFHKRSQKFVNFRSSH